MNIANFILFQLAWFITIFAAANGMPYIGALFTLIWMNVHLLVIGKQRQSELKFLLFAALIGFAFESLLVFSGIVAYPSQALFGTPAPIWMITLWINLAATINYCLSWLKKRYLLAAFLGAIAGPVAYAAGEKFGAINLFGTTSLIAISIMWLFSMPLLVWFSNALHGHRLIQDQLLSKGME